TLLNAIAFEISRALTEVFIINNVVQFHFPSQTKSCGRENFLNSLLKSIMKTSVRALEISKAIALSNVSACFHYIKPLS
ncbi:MAG: hypothetical protein AAFW75_11960, partial [Cyanobacteria bacterium J06636_16]